jgi:hypothetical protein
MAPRKTASSRRKGRQPARKVQPRSGMRQASAIFGAILVGTAILWFGWLYARQVNPSLGAINFSLPAALHSASTATATDPLVAAGITLATPAQDQQPAIGHEQAILLADQMQPEAAANAGSVSAEYVLLSDSNKTLGVTLQNTPAWVVHYTKVAEPHPDTAADPQATTTQHDLYIFLNASSGQELLALWV